MNSVDVSVTAAIELADTLKQVNSQQVDQLLMLVQTKKRIFLAGAGRSLLMLKAFAMRLMHSGYTVHVVGEVTTPAFSADDLLIAASASGETQSLIAIAAKAKSYGGSVAVLSIFDQSSLARLADSVVKVPAYTDKLPESAGNRKGILPGGSMFEEAVLVLGDSLILELARQKQIDTGKAFENHANLE